MSLINGLGTWGNQYQNRIKDQKAKESKTDADDYRKRTDKTGKAKDKQVELSDKAKALLEELKMRYADTDFFVASYSNDTEAQQYLSQGTKSFSVLIDPADLEEMAEDETVKKDTLALIDDARGNLTNLQAQLDAEGNTSVKNLGMTIDTKGNVAYFANLEQMSQNQRERIEKKRAEKAEERDAQTERLEAKREEAKAAEERYSQIKPEGKHTTVYADNTEELLEKIQNINWDDVQSEQPIPEGKRFDFSI